MVTHVIHDSLVVDMGALQTATVWRVLARSFAEAAFASAAYSSTDVMGISVASKEQLVVSLSMVCSTTDV